MKVGQNFKGITTMKRYLVLTVCLVLLAGVAVPTASAQHTYGGSTRGRTTRNVVIGAAVGGALGGLVGGGRGAVVGGAAGAAGGYVLSRRDRNRYPYYGGRQPYYGRYPPNYNYGYPNNGGYGRPAYGRHGQGYGRSRH